LSTRNGILELFSDEELKKTISFTYNALIDGDLEGALALCTEDVTLYWESYVFKGRDGIRKWIEDIREMFPIMRIIEKGYTAKGNHVFHQFLIDFTMASRRQGLLQIATRYTLRGRKIQIVSIFLGLGFLILNEKEEHRGLGYSVKTRQFRF
jgi:hypothetical protein